MFDELGNVAGPKEVDKAKAPICTTVVTYESLGKNRPREHFHYISMHLVARLLALWKSASGYSS